MSVYVGTGMFGRDRMSAAPRHVWAAHVRRLVLCDGPPAALRLREHQRCAAPALALQACGQLGTMGFGVWCLVFGVANANNVISKVLPWQFRFWFFAVLFLFLEGIREHLMWVTMI